MLSSPTDAMLGLGPLLERKKTAPVLMGPTKVRRSDPSVLSARHDEGCKINAIKFIKNSVKLCGTKFYGTG